MTCIVPPFAGVFATIPDFHHAREKRHSLSALPLLSLFCHRLGVALGEVAVADKTDETTASADTLAMLMLTAAVITGDAMFTQHAIAEGVCPGQV